MAHDKRWLTIALPKGRLREEVHDCLRAGGLGDFSDSEGDRTLLLEDHRRGIRFVWLRPADVLTYVERGVAALGVVGKDVLEETPAGVDELVDLKIGCCRVSLAVPEGLPWESILAVGDRQLRVATHLPRVAARYFSEHHIPAETIYLRGSVEIAPRLGLADAVVDIVRTGETLRRHGLVEIRRILSVTSRLIAHPGIRRGGDPRFQETVDQFILGCERLRPNAPATVEAGSRES